MAAGDARVRFVEERSRYEIEDGGTVVGFADVERWGDVMVFPHTVVDPAHRGKGYAERLVGAALDDVRARGCSVQPDCWYVAKYLREHPEVADLLGGEG